MTIPRSILREIKVALDLIHALALRPSPDRSTTVRAWGELRELQAEAAYQFGRLNEWRTGPRIHPFRLEDIGAFQVDDRCLTGSSVLDHPIHFKEREISAAVAFQPYRDHQKHFRELAAQHRLAVHIPPYPLASIYYPQAAFFVVLTTSEHPIRWLPEQILGIAS